MPERRLTRHVYGIAWPMQVPTHTSILGSCGRAGGRLRQGWQIASPRLSESDVVGGGGKRRRQSGKSNYSHTLRRATNFGTWWLSLASFYIKCRAPSHMFLFFFLCSPSPSVYQLSNCCCWISPVGVNCPPPFCQHTKEIYIPHYTPPHVLVGNHDNVNAFFLFNPPQHGQRENGRGRGRENPQGPGRKGKLACPASACAILVHTAPRTSLPGEHPLPRGKTRGEATPARAAINKGGTMAAAAAAGSKAAAAGSEAGCRPRNFGMFWIGAWVSIRIGRLLLQDGRTTFCRPGHGTGWVCLFACCFWEPWRRWDIWFMTLPFLLRLLLLLRRSSLAFSFNGNLNTMTGPRLERANRETKTLISYQGRTTSRMGCCIACMLGSILRGIEPYIRGSNCRKLAGRSGWSASRRRPWSNGSSKTPDRESAMASLHAEGTKDTSHGVVAIPLISRPDGLG